jgi:hypothetical protein
MSHQRDAASSAKEPQDLAFLTEGDWLSAQSRSAGSSAAVLGCEFQHRLGARPFRTVSTGGETSPELAGGTHCATAERGCVS